MLGQAWKVRSAASAQNCYSTVPKKVLGIDFSVALVLLFRLKSYKRIYVAIMFCLSSDPFNVMSCRLYSMGEDLSVFRGQAITLPPVSLRSFKQKLCLLWLRTNLFISLLLTSAGSYASKSSRYCAPILYIDDIFIFPVTLFFKGYPIKVTIFYHLLRALHETAPLL